MSHRLLSLFFCLATLAGCSSDDTGHHSSGASMPSSKKSVSSQQNAPPLTFAAATVRITLDPPTVQANGECTLHVTMKNVGSGVLTFNQRANPLQMFEITLEDSIGNRIEPKVDDHMYAQYIRARPLQPQEAITIDVPLSTYFPLSVPGRYRVRAAARLTVAEDTSFFEYDSNWADLAVQPGPATQPAANDPPTTAP